MEKLTHKQILKNYLQYLWRENPDSPWVEGFKLNSRELNGQWSSHKADTRCREMAVAGEILRTYRDGYAVYSYKPTLDEMDERKRAAENRQASML